MPYGNTSTGQRTFVGSDGFYAAAVCGHAAYVAADAGLARPADTTATVIGGIPASTVAGNMMQCALQAGDTGVRSVQSVTVAATTGWIRSAMPTTSGESWPSA